MGSRGNPSDKGFRVGQGFSAGHDGASAADGKSVPAADGSHAPAAAPVADVAHRSAPERGDDSQACIVPAQECWLPGSRFVASPNHDERPEGVEIDTVIIHYISLPPEYFRGDAVVELFSNTLDCGAHPFFAALDGLKVSSHFFLRRHGELIQFVPVRKRAWHAGVSRLLDRERCNDFSVGIELEGSGARPFTEAQYRRLQQLLRQLFGQLPIRYIAGHSDIAPGRKQDPGPFFEWQRLKSVMDAFGVSRPFP